MTVKLNRFLYEGPIDNQDILEVYEKMDTDINSGAMSTFIGRVRADKKDLKSDVTGIEYSAYGPMAEKRFLEIVNETNIQYKITDLLIWHSVGFVPAGKASLFISVCSKHRKDSLEALDFIVNKCKYHVPIWKKERFSDKSYRWVDETKHIHHDENIKKVEK